MRTIAMLVVLCFTCSGYIQAQTIITLTFTATFNGTYQPLDSIHIINLTQAGDTTLIGTDTVLVLDHGTWMDDIPPGFSDQLILYPPNPNPVTQSATIRLFLPWDESVSLRVYDLLGRQITVFQQRLTSGHHSFTLTPGKETFYLLSVEASRHSQVRKLISLEGEGSEATITYSGAQEEFSAKPKAISIFPWTPGDHLRFVGYSSMGADTIEDNPSQSAIHTFQFQSSVPPPIAAFAVSDTVIQVNDTVHFTDLSTGNPNVWKWYFGDGDSSSVQNSYHDYVAPGLYSVTLIVSNGGGGDTLTRQNLITVDSIVPSPVYPPGTVHCNPSNPTAIVDVVNPITGQIWMDRNLGASQVATSITDVAAYGDLYQWGRRADGHQCRTSPTTSTLSPTDLPAHGNFIISPSTPYDWRNPQNPGLWQGLNGVNNPCPSGYLLPTVSELNDELLSWGILGNSVGAFSSPLKLPAAGYRLASNGSLSNVGIHGRYWSSNVNGIGPASQNLGYNSSSAGMTSQNRGNGSSIRCLKQ